jgi:hypothetical protein
MASTGLEGPRGTLREFAAARDRAASHSPVESARRHSADEVHRNLRKRFDL